MEPSTVFINPSPAGLTYDQIVRSSVIIAGVKHSGKSTLIAALLSSFPFFRVLPCMTTRPQRPMENDLETIVMSKSAFDGIARAEEPLYLHRSAENNYMYTSTHLVECIRQGKVALLSFRNKGCVAMRSAFPQILVVVLTTSKATLEKRSRLPHRSDVPGEVDASLVAQEELLCAVTQSSTQRTLVIPNDGDFVTCSATVRNWLYSRLDRTELPC